MNKTTIRRALLIAALVLVTMFCFSTVGFAIEDDRSFWQIIWENLQAREALGQILTSFLQAFVETVVRYTQFVIEMVKNSGAVA